MKIRKVALLGLGLLALVAAPVMASEDDYSYPYEDEYEEHEDYEEHEYYEEYEHYPHPPGYERDDDYRGHRAPVAERGYGDPYEHGEAYREQYGERYEYAHEYMEHAGGSLSNHTGNASYHVQVVVGDRPVRAMAYVLSDGIVVEMDSGAAFRVSTEGELHVVALGYPVVALNLSALPPAFAVDVSTGSVKELPANATGIAVPGGGWEAAEKARGNGSAGNGTAVQEQAQERLRENASQNTSQNYTYRYTSQERIREKVEEMLRARGDVVAVKEVKVRAEDGRMLYIAVVEKPLYIGPFRLPFTVTDEVELSEDELEDLLEE